MARRRIQNIPDNLTKGGKLFIIDFVKYRFGQSFKLNEFETAWEVFHRLDRKSFDNMVQIALQQK